MASCAFRRSSHRCMSFSLLVYIFFCAARVAVCTAAIASNDLLLFFFVHHSCVCVRSVTAAVAPCGFLLLVYFVFCVASVAPDTAAIAWNDFGSHFVFFVDGIVCVSAQQPLLKTFRSSICGFVGFLFCDVRFALFSNITAAERSFALSYSCECNGSRERTLQPPMFQSSGSFLFLGVTSGSFFVCVGVRKPKHHLALFWDAWLRIPPLPVPNGGCKQHSRLMAHNNLTCNHFQHRRQ